MILGAIELICLIIFFLYYQNWGNKALTFCAGALLVLSFGFEMVEAIRLLCAADITLTLDTFYNLMKKVLNTLLAVQALLFVFALNPSVRVKIDFFHCECILGDFFHTFFVHAVNGS